MSENYQPAGKSEAKPIQPTNGKTESEPEKPDPVAVLEKAMRAEVSAVEQRLEARLQVFQDQVRSELQRIRKEAAGSSPASVAGAEQRLGGAETPEASRPPASAVTSHKVGETIYAPGWTKCWRNCGAAIRFDVQHGWVHDERDVRDMATWVPHSAHPVMAVKATCSGCSGPIRWDFDRFTWVHVDPPEWLVGHDAAPRAEESFS